MIRKLPSGTAPTPETLPSFLFGNVPAATRPQWSPGLAPPTSEVARREERPAVIKPLAEETFKFQFTASRACRDKLHRAQDLLRHRVPDGDVGTIVEKALEVLIDRVTKERFAEVRKPRKTATVEETSSGSRHIPNAIKRAVFERDGGRCTFTDEHGRRCAETGGLEFDHLDGFARTHLHEVDRIRLLCRRHNQYVAEQMYGRDFMQRARASRGSAPTLPGILSA